MLEIRNGATAATGAANPAGDAATLARALVDMVRGLPGGMATLGGAVADLAGTMPGLARQIGTAIERLLTPVERGEFAAATETPRAAESAPAPQATPVPPSPSPRSVTVQRGDTLSDIAAANGTTWQALARTNNLADPDRLAIGQRIVIPGASSAAATPAPAAQPPATPAAPAASGVSPAGLDALFAREAQAGVSDRPHWPGGASGVTLGPGYDLKGRTPASVVADLTAIGVDAPLPTGLRKGRGFRAPPRAISPPPIAMRCG